MPCHAHMIIVCIVYLSLPRKTEGTRGQICRVCRIAIVIPITENTFFCKHVCASDMTLIAIDFLIQEKTLYLKITNKSCGKKLNLNRNRDRIKRIVYVNLLTVDNFVKNVNICMKTVTDKACSNQTF